VVQHLLWKEPSCGVSIYKYLIIKEEQDAAFWPIADEGKMDRNGFADFGVSMSH
jgi:hypothetical protein